MSECRSISWEMWRYKCEDRASNRKGATYHYCWKQDDFVKCSEENCPDYLLKTRPIKPVVVIDRYKSIEKA